MRALNGAAWLAIDQGDYGQAADLLEESINLGSQLHDTLGEGIAVLYRARSKIASMRASESGPDVQRATALIRAANDPPGIAFAMLYSGLEAQFTGRAQDARDLYDHGVNTCSRTRLPAARRSVVATTRHRTARSGRPQRGAGRAGRRASRGYRARRPLDHPDRAGRVRWTGGQDRPLEAGPQAGWGGGRLQREQPVLGARPGRPGPLARTGHQVAGSCGRFCVRRGQEADPRRRGGRRLCERPEDGTSLVRALSRRELEVATLAAQGLTNRDIASQLYLSVRTVDVHIDHILTKLGFHNRTQLAAWAYETNRVPRK